MAINIWVVAIVRYCAVIIDRTIEDLERLDRKAKKILTMHGGFHLRSNVGKRYIPGNLGGRGLTSARCCAEEDLKYWQVRH